MSTDPSGHVERLLDELEYPVTGWRAEHQEISRLFCESAEPFAKLLMTPRQSHGHQDFAVNQILVRGLTDLVTAFHLAMHGYLNQAYNEMRMAFEACHLVELVGTDATEASAWIESDKPWIDFAPKKVRDKLDVNSPDGEVYSLMCGMAHPRFEGASLTGYQSTSPDGSSAVNLSVGPSPLLDERPYLAHALIFISLTLQKLAAGAQHLVGPSGIDEASVISCLKEMTVKSVELLAVTHELAASSGQPAAVAAFEELEKSYRDGVGQLITEAEST